MNFSDAVRVCMSKYVDFKGRARRSEYWNFALFGIILGVLLVILNILLLVPLPLPLIGSIALFLPSLSSTVRRLHDTSKSGLFVLIGLIPVIGTIILIILLCVDSDPGENAYGPNPKETHQRNVVRTPPRASSSPAQAQPLPVQSNPQQALPPAPRPYIPPQSSSHVVTCISGPLQGTTVPISQGTLTFGRDTACDVTFPATTPGVSQNHLRLTADAGRLFLMDLGSTYGTYLADGTKLYPGQQHEVRPNTQFFLGSQQVGFTVQ